MSKKHKREVVGSYVENGVTVNVLAPIPTKKASWMRGDRMAEMSNRMDGVSGGYCGKFHRKPGRI